MAILVTGAAGFVGNNTVRRLAGMGRPVRAVVRDVAKAQKRLADVAGAIEVVRGDVTDREALVPMMEDVTAVIHLVAIALEKGRQTYEDVNYQGSANVVDAANRAAVERFVFMSQNGADRASPHRFLHSKGRAEDYVARHARNWTALRPSSIFGPQDEFFNSIARLVRLTPIIYPLIGGGTARFQPISVHDVTESIVRSLDDDTTVGKLLALGGPEVLTLGEIERRIIEALHTQRILFPAPVSLLRGPVLIMEHLLPGSPVSSDLLDLLAVPNVIEDNALVNHFRIEPTPFKGEHIAYLERNTVSTSLRRILKGETVN